MKKKMIVAVASLVMFSSCICKCYKYEALTQILGIADPFDLGDIPAGEAGPND